MTIYEQFKEKLLASTTQEHRNNLVDLVSDDGGTKIYKEKPITLEDVLMVLGERNICDDECIEYQVLSDLFFIYFYSGGDIETTKWQLGKPAHLQSGETLKALTNLFNITKPTN